MRFEKHQNHRSSLLIGLLFGFTLGYLALGSGPLARASDLQDFVNSKIKEEFIKMDAEQLRVSAELPQTVENLQPANEWPQPLKFKDPLIDHQPPAAYGENPAHVEMPRAGLANKLDPADPVEKQVADKQAYDLYREHYRQAVHKEFVRRLHQAGWETTRNIAEEIKAKEMQMPGAY